MRRSLGGDIWRGGRIPEIVLQKPEKRIADLVVILVICRRNREAQTAGETSGSRPSADDEFFAGLAGIARPGDGRPASSGRRPKWAGDPLAIPVTAVTTPPEPFLDENVPSASRVKVTGPAIRGDYQRAIFDFHINAPDNVDVPCSSMQPGLCNDRKPRRRRGETRSTRQRTPSCASV